MQLLAVLVLSALSFDFEVTGAKPLRGRAVVVADTPDRGPQLRVQYNATTVWSDGRRVDVIDTQLGTHTHSTLSRAGLVLLGRSTRNVANPFAFSSWASDFAEYKPKPAGTSVVRGVACKVTELLIPNGGWRWHYDAQGRLRREERLASKEVVDYFNFGTAGSVGARPAIPRGVTSKEFMPAGPAPGTIPAAWPAGESLRGRVVIVDFWASWCGPCRASMPHLQKLYSEYRTRGLEVLGISWRDTADAKAFAEKNGITYPLSASPEAVAAFGPDEYGIPLVYILGRDGRVIDFTVGYSGAKTDRWLRETVERALGVSASSPDTR